MKLGEGGEAFFVFQTSGNIPVDLQTSPLVSPASSPRAEPSVPDATSLQEPDFLSIDEPGGTKKLEAVEPRRTLSDFGETISDLEGAPGLMEAGNPTPLSPIHDITRPISGDWSGGQHLERCRSDEGLTTATRRYTTSGDVSGPIRPRSPPPLDPAAAVERALALSRKLSVSNIQTHVTNKGDVMLDMHGFKLDQEEIAQAETLARKILAEEMDGDYDLGSLIGADRHGNLWIYSSEEAKEQAGKTDGISQGIDIGSDGGYSSDEAKSEGDYVVDTKRGLRETSTPPTTPPSSPPLISSSNDSGRNYAKTLRLTSDQLKSLNLKHGNNEISFSVNRATCTASMYLWRHDVPIVVSDVDGTITKSDALGHVFTMIGRDWTHLGVAKLYTDICANGYNIMYLTSRSVGQADTTRNYLSGIVQESYKLPKGPVIMSPDRTFHALRREVYLRKPEVFKMACLRDILNLFSGDNPFYAGFGNRLTDALSYRSVNIPSTRIFTINSNAEVSLDLLCLTRYKSSYVNIRDLVDHFFPPVARVMGIAEEYTDFNYWRDDIPAIDDFSDSDADHSDSDSDINDDDLPVDSYIDDEEAEQYSDAQDGESEYEEYSDEDDRLSEGEEYDEEDDVYHEDVSNGDTKKQDAETKALTESQGSNFRRPIMKNDLDRSTLDAARDFAEIELGSIAEEIKTDFNKLIGRKPTTEFEADGEKKEEKKEKDETGELADDASIDE